MIAIQEPRIAQSSNAASMIHQHYMQSDIPATNLGPVMQQQQPQQQSQHYQQRQHHNPQQQQQRQQQQQQQQQQQRRQQSSAASSSSASVSPNQSDNNSMSTATPPHQISQRASPASTALVMSNNNINGTVQPSSRQLTPNTSSSNNGTGSSSNGNTGQHHNGTGVDGSVAPNPMVRQFALHAKSMSAGIVVPVPGISNNLATATGMNHNNIINNNIASSNHHHQPHAPAHTNGHHHHHHHRTNGIITGTNALSGNSMVPYNSSNHHHNASAMTSANHHHNSSANNNTSNQVLVQQPIHSIAPPYRTSKSSSHHRNNNNHHKQLSQPNPQPTHHHHLQQPQNPQSLSQGLFQHNAQDTHHGHHQHDHPAPYHNNDSSEQFIHHELPTRQQTTSSSIVLSNDTNINNIHSRSASTHLSNILLGPNAQSHHQNSINHQQSKNFHHQQAQQTQHMSNSIWTIGENISKSHSKLTASSYLHQPYLFNAPLTNVSCDNISNPSRLIDGAPAPGYYLHASNNLPNSNAHLSTSGSTKTPEFLPICDLMFNLISMIIYFCENTFGIIALIALHYHATGKHWALMGTLFVVASNIICQYTSLRWIYKTKLDQCERKQKAQNDLAEEENCERRCYNRMSANIRNYPCGSCNWLPEGPTEVQLRFLISIVLHAISHLFCLGFLIRYIKLVIPVTDTTRVKKEARDLCMLRLIHGFVQSAPLLLLQSYLIASQNSAGSVANLSMISAILSLVNVCWALASFTKYARKKYMHKFVLTWLGIMSQFLWRLGTVSSRIATLVIYAVYYNYWMLVILALHWLTMFCWLMKPGNLLRDEVNMSRAKKLAHALGTSWIYCFCYVNFEEHNSRAKIGSFYMIMFFENNVLFSVCLFFTSQSTWFKSLSMLVVYLGFALGMIFMYLYYKFFHVSALDSSLSCSQDSIDSIADQLSPAGKKIAGFKPGTLRLRSEDSLTSDRRFIDNISTTLRTGSHPEITRGIKPQYLGPNQVSLQESGVFDCKLSTRPKDRKSTETYHCS